MIRELRPEILQLVPAEIMDLQGRLPPLEEAEDLMRSKVIRTFNSHNPRHPIETEGPFEPIKGDMNTENVWPGNHIRFRQKLRQVAALVSVPHPDHPHDIDRDLVLVYLYKGKH